MARMQVKKRFCDRCIKDTLAVTTLKFSVGETEYEMDVCDKHADMFQRDMLGWTRLAREKEKPNFFGRSQVKLQTDRNLARAESDRAAAAAAAAAERAARERKEPQLEAIPGPALDWKLSDHAEEQLEKRGPSYGFGKREVLLAAYEPEHSYLADDDHCYRHNRGPVSCVVDRDRSIIVTVMPNLPEWGDDGEKKKEALSGRR